MSGNPEFAQMAELLKQGRHVEVRSKCIDLLRRIPQAAQAWVFLGQALELAGERYAAWYAFDRGWFLDPEASWVTEVFQRLKGYERGPCPVWLRSLLRVKEVSVSAVILARDEERTIAQCIQRVRPAVDEVVVVDTGSSDGTPAIARDWGARVVEFEWRDDFSAARNFGLEMARGDWVLFVDADELLYPEDVPNVKVAAGLFDGLDPAALLRVVQVNRINGQLVPNTEMVRMVPNDGRFRWWGRIHEQLGPSSGLMDASVRVAKPAVRIRLDHDGYEPEISRTKGKIQRNIRLLEMAVQDDPTDVGAWGFLGRERMFNGEYASALEALDKAESLAEANPLYARTSEVRLFKAECLMKLGRFEEALHMARKVVETDPGLPNGWQMLAVIALEFAGRLIGEARTATGRALEAYPQYRGLITPDWELPQWKGAALIGDTFRMAGDLVSARAWYLKALAGNPGAELVRAQLESIKRQSETLVETASTQGNPS